MTLELQPIDLSPQQWDVQYERDGRTFSRTVEGTEADAQGVADDLGGQVVGEIVGVYE